ncbi:hypothetical protein DQ04_00051060 [Trypanosoma grayi]|uniref:hypothetical protein n=1 Tax=Trypanosoma grayi TaxID=71804 RepID=UPI0004F43882|nr:hypothetical protein DQ04_00051060 [Trypanosoma grayi]KEG15511.1 hypothetical protein DQ04_00051060 [Trypanosoma grayi]
MTYRVLGSPYALVLHQHVAYLRLKRLPFKVYCRTFTTTLFYALVYRARNSFCTVTPDGKSYLQLWQLVDAVERASALQHQEETIVVKKRTHPKIHLVSWTVVLYASWWLCKTGAMYRWIDGDSVDVVEGYLRYFFLVPGIGMSRAIVGPFRQAMQKLTSTTGVSTETAPYMREHFQRLCNALDTHFEQNPEMLFLLGTPHPTLADVALGAAFSANFLMDDPPASLLAQKYPHLNRYLENVTGWRGGVFVSEEHAKQSSRSVSAVPGCAKTDGYVDVVPDSLSSFLQLIEEVLPFMLSQCVAFHAFMAGDGVRHLKKEPLERPWEGCSGYLMPQVTDVKSLMIIDNGIYTVSARAQDLEVALLAAREVVDDDDDDNEDNNDVESFGSVPSSRETSSVDSAVKDTSVVNSSTLVRESTATRAVVSSLQSSSPAVEGPDAPSDEMLADDADFHRVFTAASGRAHSVLQPRRASGQLGQTMMDSRLHALRSMLCKMHHPHYTLSSVFHGRKMYVAVIPEHEVARKRNKR